MSHFKLTFSFFCVFFCEVAKMCYESWQKGDSITEMDFLEALKMSNCEIEVKNSDSNEKLRRELKRVREENRKLKRIISYGKVSVLETLIEQYMEYSRVHLKKIALEIQLADYEKSVMAKVQELVEHLEYTKEELHKLIEVGEEGAVIHNDSLKHDVKMAREMIPKFEEIIQLHIDANKSEELEKILREFAQKIQKYF